MRIPRDTQSILDKLAKAKPAKKVTAVTPAIKEKEPEIEPGSGREAAKLRQRAKKAEAEIETLRAQLAEQTTTIESLESLRPAAQQWNHYEHVERQKLLQSLPPELRADAKTMQLNHLRLFVKREAAPAPDKGKVPVDKMDLDALQKSGDKKAINEYVEGVKNGTITPAMPKEADV